MVQEKGQITQCIATFYKNALGRGMYFQGAIDILFETTSHAEKYPYDYVGLFWGTVVQEGGQRGFDTLVKDGEAGVRWSYFSASGDATVTDRHTILGPDMDVPEHDPKHPQHYYFAQSGKRFTLPIQVGRW